MTTDISSADNIINMSDVTDRVEELRDELQNAMDENEEGHNLETLSEYVKACAADASAAHAHKLHDEAVELLQLESLLDDVRGNGGDHQWEGDWYPGSMIHAAYFEDAMRELCEDIGDFPNGVPSYYVIDWAATADNLRVDYTSVEFDGQEFWYR